MMDYKQWMEFLTCAFVPALVFFGLFMSWRIKNTRIHDTGTGKKHTRAVSKGY